MGKIQQIRDIYTSNGEATTEHLRYLLDIIDALRTYLLVEASPPDICVACPYQDDNVSYYDCERPLEDCEERLEEFFERALGLWYERLAMEGVEVPDATLH